MSDIKRVLDVTARRYKDDRGRVFISMNGDRGVWHLYLEFPEWQPAQGGGEPFPRVNLTLEDLKHLHDRLGNVLNAIETQPNDYNAEVRAAAKKVKREAKKQAK